MIAIIKYSGGNVMSVQNAVHSLGYETVISSDRDVIASADKIIFPGVGEASSAMASLKISGLDELLPTFTQPVLGICLGLQLMCSKSDEHSTTCLNIFQDVLVNRFPENEIVPHMGWNTCTDYSGKLFENILPQTDFYFVHSYYAPVNEYSLATTNYLLPFSAAMQKDNFYATQFHPEKSGAAGLSLLKNFLSL